MAYTIGGIAIVLLFATWLLLPVLKRSGKTWVTIVVICVGLSVYIWSRRFVHRRWLRRDQDGNRPAPPFGREWMRWVVAFVL